MSDQSRPPHSSLGVFLQSRLAPALTAIYLAITLLGFLSFPILYILSSRLSPLNTSSGLTSQLSYFFIPYGTGLIFLGCGLYVYVLRRHEPAGKAFVVLAASGAIALGGIFEATTSHVFSGFWLVSLVMIAGSLLNLGMVFPKRLRIVSRYPILPWLTYFPASLMLIVIALSFIGLPSSMVYAGYWRAVIIFNAVAVFFFLGLLAYFRFTSNSPMEREQARLGHLAALFSLAPIAGWLLWKSILPSTQFTLWLLLPLGFFPLLLGYAILQYRLLITDLVLSRALLYSILTVVVAIGYSLLVIGFSQLFGYVLSPSNPILITLLVCIVVISFYPLRNFLQKRIDMAFARGQVAQVEHQQAFARELTRAMELPQIAVLLHRYIEQVIEPSQLHIFIFDAFLGHYVAMADEDGRISSQVRFPANSALVGLLSNRREALFLSDIQEPSNALYADQARLALLSTQLFVPLPGRKQLIGWVSLSERRSGEPYTSGDLVLLGALSDQAALAVERAQVVDDLERRVREMNVLTRVAQGVSFTVAFDDILELLSAQANLVLPARDFRVTLYDQDTQVFRHVFFLEDDERLKQHEKRLLSMSQGLEWEVISNQRAILTDDYERECRGRGLLPATQGLYAWMGVPLNAGAETIGVVSVGSRDPAVIYTDEQQDLLQAIADQASGAIVKARLLEESERRARQLAMLNEISRDLTATLEIQPLLKQILENAVEILNCEAGSLFLIDSETDELVFEVVSGPVADDLLGQRLPPGTGMVGQAAQSGRPMIANDAKRRKEWFEKADEETGFDTKDLLAVPMRMQDRIIGVIEVINKLDGAPFTEADQELLTAFTSQATVAMENARLYTMTDKALADRVEELSVMQRIDRELNASLDIERAMRITLDWAIRQSKVEAGLVGILAPEGVQVMVAEGYGEEIAQIQPSGNGAPPLIPLDMPALNAAIESGLPQRFLSSHQSFDGNYSLLSNPVMQIAIPIRRETDILGVLLLESAQVKDCPDELLSFLSRLSDHAAIAISNAQLYEEVNEANLAKSKFVSFVAHELKNPMASIKGYTELVTGGMAGPVNEMQNSFLSTVRSNVERMNTIVSDLNDLTKIQIGNLRLDYSAVLVKEVVDEIIQSLIRQFEEKDQKTRIEFPKDLPNVWADPSRLNQILTNLLSNAIKYSHEGGEIVIGAELYRKEGGISEGGGYVHIWVQDTGIGIAEEDRQEIFQQYFRTEVAKEMAAGTGLGLNITKSLVEMQGGKIWFESVLNKGTTFHFTVPVAEDQ